MGRIILITLFLSVFIVASVFAGPRKILQAAEKLELTEDQVSQIEELGFQHRKLMIAKEADLKQLKLEFKHNLGKLDIDEKELMNLQDNLSKKKAELAKARLVHRLEIRNLLSEKQLEKWIKINKMRNRHERSGRPDGPPREMMERMHKPGPPKWMEWHRDDTKDQE
jgi:Spy/CpxP family protein refolding chaperone